MNLNDTDLDLKKTLIEEIKRDEWRNSINEEEYRTNSNLIDKLHRQNLETISKQNKAFKYKKIIGIQPKTTNKINAEAQEAYEKWKKENYSKKKCPEVSVQNLLLLLHYLSAGPTENDQKDIHECLKRQNSDFEVFWDSPSYILKVLRKCVLTRDWNNMTYFSLLLLNYNKKYLKIIRNMCKIMVKFNPLIQECSLEDQFNNLIRIQTEEELTIV